MNHGTIFASMALAFFLSPALAQSEETTVTFDDLIYREGVFYHKSAGDNPFSGTVKKAGQRWAFLNGKAEGPYVSFHDNGQLASMGSYLNGERNGEWLTYHVSGQLMIKETLQNGERHGAWEYYFINGQLREKGNYKNGNMDGAWIGFSVNGNVNEEYTGNFKDGVKVD
ncbi:MAG: hypothetical protein CMM32_09530 [Rhodospirillaceae bacterium]|nr:hypothetical protein [Rhodospirillaceae bacterium]|tara:strand:+ start:1876 stop:2382 length:507 start_codon:yes stop_codon:yes gene_type:complete